MTRDEHVALERFVAAVRTHYGARLDDVLVFGSRARGDATADSDLDLAIVLRDGVGDYWAEKFALSDLSCPALVEAGLFIQCFPISRREWEAPETHYNPEFVRNIRRDAKPLGAVA